MTMTLNDFKNQCLVDLGCYEARHMATMQPCEWARRNRMKLMQALMCEALKPGGEILEIGGITKSRAEYIKALEELVEFTYRICELAAKEQGPFMIHQTAGDCGEHHYCDPRRRYARRMW